MIVTAKTTQRSAIARRRLLAARVATAVAQTPNALPATARRMPSSTLLLALACAHAKSVGYEPPPGNNAADSTDDVVCLRRHEYAALLADRAALRELRARDGAYDDESAPPRDAFVDLEDDAFDGNEQPARPGCFDRHLVGRRAHQS